LTILLPYDVSDGLVYNLLLYIPYIIFYHIKVIRQFFDVLPKFVDKGDNNDNNPNIYNVERDNRLYTGIQ
jgi:hypothetical protein